VTAVPTAPEAGLTAKAGVGIVNGAVFVSLGAFVVTVTVYPPGDAPAATVKWPVKLPLEIEHVGVDEKRPNGVEDRLQVVPA
jgi:hypothetical protein